MLKSVSVLSAAKSQLLPRHPAVPLLALRPCLHYSGPTAATVQVIGPFVRFFQLWALMEVTKVFFVVAILHCL
jgi:hypothetical protein